MFYNVIIELSNYTQKQHVLTPFDKVKKDILIHYVVGMLNGNINKKCQHETNNLLQGQITFF